MKYLLITLLAFSCTAFAQNNELSKVDQIIQEVNAKDPGVIIGIVKDKELIQTSSKGLANLDYELPINSSTNFRLSSTSKQFTAAAIHLLALDGKFSLKDRIKLFFPEYSEKLGNVTVRQLLNHTSGIRDYMSLMMLQSSPKMDFFNSFTGEDKDIADMLNQQVDLAFPSGTKHSYSNTNYWILGKIVEQISGKSLEVFTTENIFSPLKMERTFFIGHKGQIVPNRAAGYVSKCPDCPRMEYNSQANTAGDDGLVSSINDLLLWENEFHNPTIFSTQFWNNMRQEGRLNNGETIDYASGLIHGAFNEEKMISHSGQNPGYCSDIMRFPEHDISIIILANQNWYDVRSYGGQVAALFFPSKEPIVEVQATETNTETVLGPNELDRFCGDFHFIETNEYRTIKREGKDLIYVRNNGPSDKLIAISNRTLTFENRRNVVMSFTFDDQGNKFIEWKDGAIYQHAKSYKKVVISYDKLPEFQSTYLSGELSMDMEIVMEGGKLMLPIFGRKIPLELTSIDNFSAMGMFSLNFVRDQNNLITGFRLDAPRAENIWFSKK